MLVLQAWRSWRGSKGVAVLAAGALTVGIGAASAIYTVVNAVMLRPLPYAHGERFVAIFGGSDTDPEHFSSLSSNDARTYSAATQAFDAFGWFRGAGKNLTFAGEPHHVQGVSVTVPLIQQLGVTPLHGQWFTDETGVVLSRSLWQRLGGDPAIVGKPLTLDGRSYTVTGVMPETFRLPVADIGGTGTTTDLWLPLDPAENAGAAYFAYARRKPGVSIDAAAADAKRVAAVMAKADPDRPPGLHRPPLRSSETVAINEIRPTLLLLFAAAGLPLPDHVRERRRAAAGPLRGTHARNGHARRRSAPGDAISRRCYFLERRAGGVCRRRRRDPRERDADARHRVAGVRLHPSGRGGRSRLDGPWLRADGAAFLRACSRGSRLCGRRSGCAGRCARRRGAHDGGRAQPPHLAVAGRGGDRAGVRAARRQRRAVAALAAVVADGARLRPGRNPDVHRQPPRAGRER